MGGGNGLVLGLRGRGRRVTKKIEHEDKRTYSSQLITGEGKVINIHGCETKPLKEDQDMANQSPHISKEDQARVAELVKALEKGTEAKVTAANVSEVSKQLGEAGAKANQTITKPHKPAPAWEPLHGQPIPDGNASDITALFVGGPLDGEIKYYKKELPKELRWVRPLENKLPPPIGKLTVEQALALDKPEVPKTAEERTIYHMTRNNGPFYIYRNVSLTTKQVDENLIEAYHAFKVPG